MGQVEAWTSWWLSPAAVADVRDGASIGIAGFGVAHRFPSRLIIALRDKGSSGLTVYCNGLGSRANRA